MTKKPRENSFSAYILRPGSGYVNLEESEADHRARQATRDEFDLSEPEAAAEIIAKDQARAAKAAALAKYLGCNCGWISTTNNAYQHRDDCPAAGQTMAEIKLDDFETAVILALRDRARVIDNAVASDLGMKIAEQGRELESYKAELGKILAENEELHSRIDKVYLGASEADRQAKKYILEIQGQLVERNNRLLLLQARVARMQARGEITPNVATQLRLLIVEEKN